MGYVAPFFVGAFLCNAVPHLAAGLLGMKFPSPFAKPPGQGDSSPLVNFLWGVLNLAIGLTLLVWHPLVLGANRSSLALAAGALVLGIMMSRHFGKVRAAKAN